MITTKEMAMLEAQETKALQAFVKGQGKNFEKLHPYYQELLKKTFLVGYNTGARDAVRNLNALVKVQK